MDGGGKCLDILAIDRIEETVDGIQLGSSSGRRAARFELDRQDGGIR